MDSPFITRFLKEIREDWVEFAVLAGVSGVADTVLRVVVNLGMLDAMEGGVSAGHLATFMSFAVIYILTRYLFLRQAGIAVATMVFDLRTGISAKLSRCELARVERLGPAEVELHLGRDIATLAAPSNHLFSPITTVVSLVLTLAYLATLSLVTSLVVLAVHLAFIFYLYERRKWAMEEMREGAAVEATLFAKLHSLIAGFKEVKLHDARRQALVDGRIVPLAGEARVKQDEVNRIQAQNFVALDAFHYVTIGIPIFILPPLAVLTGDTVAQVLALLIFLFGSVPELIIAMTLLAQYDVATQSLEALEERLSSSPAGPAGGARAGALAREPFETLEIDGLCFTYHDRADEALFTVGPVDLTLRRGEIVFIVGGNGSGKTTLLRALCGLYPASHGALRLNGAEVDARSLDAYRALFSAVFTDFHLFDQLYGLEATATPERVNAMLERFELSEKTRFTGGGFQTLELSTGQRKRLALLTALLEERPICILDEVAADQDPEFRKAYYEELLPELKARGKALLVVSHDDRYFHVADQVLHMDYGRVRALYRPGSGAPAPALAPGPLAGPLEG